MMSDANWRLHGLPHEHQGYYNSETAQPSPCFITLFHKILNSQPRQNCGTADTLPTYTRHPTYNLNPPDTRPGDPCHANTQSESLQQKWVTNPRSPSQSTPYARVCLGRNQVKWWLCTTRLTYPDRISAYRDVSSEEKVVPPPGAMDVADARHYCSHDAAIRLDEGPCPVSMQHTPHASFAPPARDHALRGSRSLHPPN